MSTTQQSTCSPWSAYRDHRGQWYVRSSSGQFLATMAIGINRLDRSHARLMAAAPELMIGLQELLLTTELNLDDLEPATRATITLAQRAIAAAGHASDHPDSIRLARAAPDLLRALDYVSQWSITARDDDFPYAVVEAALKKARGR